MCKPVWFVGCRSGLHRCCCSDNKARPAISGADIVFMCAATVWEASIKDALSLLKLPETVEKGVEDNQFEKLPISPKDILT